MVCGQLFDISLRTAQDEDGARTADIDGRPLDGVVGRTDGQRLETRQSVHQQPLCLLLAEERCGECLGQLPVVLIAAQRRTSRLHSLVVLRCRLAQWRPDIISNRVNHFSLFTSSSVSATLMSVWAMTSSPTLTTTSANVRLKTASTMWMCVVSVSLQRG